MDSTSGASPTSTPSLDTSDGSSDGGGSDDQSAVAVLVAASAGILGIMLIVTVLVAVAIVVRKGKKLGYIHVPRDLELEETEAYGVAGTAGPRLENNPAYRAFGESTLYLQNSLICIAGVK